MNMKDRIIKSQLKRLGIDVNHPKQVTKKALRDLVNTSVPSLFSAMEMIAYLNELIDILDKEYN